MKVSGYQFWKDICETFSYLFIGITFLYDKVGVSILVPIAGVVAIGISMVMMILKKID